MNIDDLYALLRNAQEPKGFYFNKNREMVNDLLRGLVINKERYGYMSCPCRLSIGEREKDRDIICPCEYRSADIAAYGTCYCALYVSKDFNEGKVAPQVVPERRPPEKRPF